MKICVVGIGYIGLPTACILSNKGFDVVAVDINEKYINTLLNNEFKSKENNLTEIVKQALENKNFSLQMNPEKSDVFIICTPTPLDNDNKADLSYLINAVYSVIPYLEKNNIVIIESTIPPKTTSEIIKPIIESTGFEVGTDIYLAYCPERVIPGNIIFELVHNNRIIGGCTKQCGDIVAEFYKEFVEGEIYTTTSEVAEMVKLVENSYRDVNIALVNEIAMVCNELFINPYEVINLANKHPRVKLLNPGIGVGGHCLPVDPYFIIQNSPGSSKLMLTSRLINDNMPEYIVTKIEKILEFADSPKIGIWGVTYKNNSDDIRNSPSRKIANLLQNKGYNVATYDPLVDGMNSNDSKINSVKDRDLLLVLIDHDEFKKENYELISSLMKTPIIFDANNIIDKSKLSNKIILYNLANI